MDVNTRRLDTNNHCRRHCCILLPGFETLLPNIGDCPHNNGLCEPLC